MQPTLFLVAAGLSTLAHAAPASSSYPQSTLPQVDLGYSVHQAISLNESSALYNFSNVRYAEPPVGNRRFQAPVAVSGRNQSVDNGSVGRICPQAFPGWFPDAEAFLASYLSGQSFTPPSPANGSSHPAVDPRTNEDCLFLDVIVPKSIFEAKNKTQKGANVVVWIFGGGYVSGDKTNYDPSGLIATSAEPFIFVAINYRLGAFGFLSGSSIEHAATSQPALLDQRLALQWVQKYIHLFGGSPSSVTVMGESAGAGSIMHQITAYGGKNGSAPFQRAILQSPAFTAQPAVEEAENKTRTFMNLCNVTSVEALQRLPSAALMAANARQVGASPYGQFTFGPAVDGNFAPSLPSKLLAQGAFDHKVEIMVGHNSDEGVLFTSPYANTSTTFASAVKETFPTISDADLRRAEDEIYPPVFNGSQPYTNQLDRTKVFVADTFVTCNTDYLNRAFDEKTYAYEFSVFPGIHGQDLNFTFSNGAANNPTTPIANILQGYLTSFVVDGVPTTKNHSLPAFPQHGQRAQLLNISSTGVAIGIDDTRNERCKFWQQVL